MDTQDTQENRLLRLSGSAFLNQEIQAPRDGADGDELHLQITNGSGDVVAEGFGQVTSVTRKQRKLKKGDRGPTTERVFAAPFS